jgi:hypothetical protein
MKTIALALVLGLVTLACGGSKEETPDAGVPPEKTVMLEVEGMT